MNATPDPRWAPHATVATVVIDGGRVLLVEETIDGRQVLNQPAGHLEPGESLAEAALRETREETGWTVQLIHFIGCYQWTAGDGTAFELRVEVVEYQLQVAVEVPVNADRPGLRAARGHGRVGWRSSQA